MDLACQQSQRSLRELLDPQSLSEIGRRPDKFHQPSSRLDAGPLRRGGLRRGGHLVGAQGGVPSVRAGMLPSCLPPLLLLLPRRCLRPRAPLALTLFGHRRQALKVHPDKNADDPQAKERFQALQDAWATLGDEDRRAEYDRGLRRREQPRQRPRQQPRQRQPQRPTQPTQRPADDGPHTTVYFRSARDDKKASRAAAAEQKRQRHEQEQGAQRDAMEARMQSRAWDKPAGSWRQSWAEAPAAKRQRGAAAQPGVVPVAAAATAGGEPVRHACLLCRRQFKQLEMLERHVQQSELHRHNLQKKQLLEADGSTAAAAGRSDLT